MAFENSTGPMSWLDTGTQSAETILPIEASDAFWTQLAVLGVMGVVLWAMS